MPSSRLPALAGALSLLLVPLLPSAPARAHAVQSTLEAFHTHSHGPGSGAAMARSAGGGAGEEIRLNSSFSTGEPLVAAAVRVVPPDGGAGLDLGRTDAHGSLTFRLPGQVKPDWELQVDGGPGHRDYLELPSVTAQARPAGPLRGELARSGRQLGLFALVGSLCLGGLGAARRRS